MKRNQEQDDDNRLHFALREWVVDSPLPPRFQDRVWQQIARAEVRPESGFWGSIIRLVEAALRRPKIALSYVTTLLVLGVVAGSITAQVRSSHVNANLSARYVQSLDPYRSDTAQP